MPCPNQPLCYGTVCDVTVDALAEPLVRRPKYVQHSIREGEERHSLSNEYIQDSGSSLMLPYKGVAIITRFANEGGIQG